MITPMVTMMMKAAGLAKDCAVAITPRIASSIALVSMTISGPISFPRKVVTPTKAGVRRLSPRPVLDRSEAFSYALNLDKLFS